MSGPLEHIRLVEVGPRDGLQNEATFVPTAVKVAFVDALSDAGLEEIEVSSFVSPRWVPQLADGAEVLRSIRRRPGTVYSALVPNERGLDAAIAAGVDKVCVFTAASETFNRKNINATIAESLARITAVVHRASVPVRGYVSTAFHCPFEGRVAPERVVAVADDLMRMGCAELSIGDTIGTATVSEVEALIALLVPRIPVQQLAMHFHDTFGRAMANVAAAAAAGVTIFDGSVGGIGGCPYAPGAPGNVGTEALVAHFGARTRVDPVQLARASALLRPFLA
jgi:hydroxymethylglutaryl-CoA lyase